MAGSAPRYLPRLPFDAVPPEEIPPHATGDVTSKSPGSPLERRIANAERVRSMLAVRVGEARERLAEAESRVSVPPAVLGRLGATLTEAQQRVELERAEAENVVAALAAHAERKAMLVLAPAEDEAP